MPEVVPQQRREMSQVITSSNLPKHQQRPSLISLFTGSGLQQPSSNPSSGVTHDSRSGTGVCTPSDTLSQNTLHPPRESLSSSSTTPNKEPGVSDSHSGDGTTPTPSLLAGSANLVSLLKTPKGDNSVTPHLTHSMSLQQQPLKTTHPPRLRFVSSVEFRHSSGETSTTPLSPDSAADDSSGEMQKPRLQRSKAQSRKTFRLRRGRPPHGDITPHISVQEQEQQIQIQQQQVIPQSKPVADLSWDSVSQTSSTSGYRDNCSIQTGFLSPDGSLSGPPLCGRSSSHNSLLMLFETQDEDTLI